jgi:hypothetical protein
VRARRICPAGLGTAAGNHDRDRHRPGRGWAGAGERDRARSRCALEEAGVGEARRSDRVRLASRRTRSVNRRS